MRSESKNYARIFLTLVSTVLLSSPRGKPELGAVQIANLRLSIPSLRILLMDKASTINADGLQVHVLHAQSLQQIGVSDKLRKRDS